MSNLQAIVYVSSASHLFGQEELEKLLSAARVRNLADGITGFMIYCDGNFMQYVEGPKESVLRAYGRIRADDRHHDIIELVNEPVTSREFPEWSMAYSPAQMQDFLRVTKGDWESLEAAEGSSRSVQGRLLLRDFWQHQN